MESTTGPQSRQQRRREAARAGKPPGDRPAPALTLTDRWMARKVKERASRDAARESVELTLPSLLTVRAHRLNLESLFALGEIPNAFLPTINRWAQIFATTPEPLRKEALDADAKANYTEFRRIVVHVWLKSVEEPAFTVVDRAPADNPDGDPMPLIVLADRPDLPEVDETDLVWLFEWAQGVDKPTLDYFREGQETDISPLQTIDGGRDVSSDIPGDRSAGEPVAGVSVE